MGKRSYVFTAASLVCSEMCYWSDVSCSFIALLDCPNVKDCEDVFSYVIYGCMVYSLVFLDNNVHARVMLYTNDLPL